MTSAAPEGAESGEDRLIAKYFKPLARHPGALGLIDDAAILTPPAGHDVVLKADAIIGGVHFFPDDPADAVARKALRVNLSDLAAKGAEPAGFLLSLALPAATDEAWIASFAHGLGQDAERYGCPLLGGDTDRTPGPAMISIAAFGLVPHGRMVPRSGARVGDAVMVTGTIGDAVLGLALRREPDRAAAWGLDAALREHLAARYLLPQPRNAIAAAVRAHASGSMDVSDGLVGDLGKLCRASGVAADVEVARVPLSQAARRALAQEPAVMEAMLTGGDDYEVLCTVAPDRVASFQAAAQGAQVAVTRIGTVRAGQGAHFRDADNKAMRFARSAYSHF
jgi:thiamine-monophosphate kinase